MTFKCLIYDIKTYINNEMTFKCAQTVIINIISV